MVKTLNWILVSLTVLAAVQANAGKLPLSEKQRIEVLSQRLDAAQKLYGQKPVHVKYYKFPFDLETDKNGVKTQKVNYRVLVRYHDANNKITDAFFQDKTRQVVFNLTELTEETRDWGSYYVKDSKGRYTNINDDGNDGEIEAQNNQLGSSYLETEFHGENNLYPVVYNQVATCGEEGKSNVKGMGSKFWFEDNFTYLITYPEGETCRGDSKVEAVYQEIDQEEGEYIFNQL